ncbi:hypothetical protein ABZ260_07470 [Streptosporangium sp. NPDC006013]|uniref:hypothetical protein n=1 Tax=Streptosporangium sp. NPDC006013 TaxID=3155596 RepID=UPI0033A8ED29
MRPPTAVGHNELLGHAVRLEDWAQQGESTYVRAREALAADDVESAVSLAELTAQEAQEAFDLYLLWLGRLPALLVELGVPDGNLAPTRDLAARTAETLEAGWATYREHLAAFGVRARARDTPGAEEELEAGRMVWQTAHDPATDALCALIAVGVDALGEDCVGPLWDRLLAHYYAALGEKYDPATRPWRQSLERLVLDIFEATRGHLSGPERDGNFEVWEEPDRWVVRFEPCGSGGRTYVDPESTPGRTFTQSEHDWAWRTTGVCHYCVHCCQLQQRAPIEHLGMPLRVVEPPVRPDGEGPGRDQCTWSLYKDPALLPDEAFTSVGAPVPSWLSRSRRS